MARPGSRADSVPAMPFIDLKDFSDPRLDDYRIIKDRQLTVEFIRNAEAYRNPSVVRKFMAEGESVVGTLVRSQYPTVSVLCARQRLEHMAGYLAPLSPDVPVYVLDKSHIEPLVGFSVHRGVMAIGSYPTEADPIAVASLCRPGRPLLVLEDIFNHDNIGGLFRNAAAFGAAGIILNDRCSDPLYRKAIRVSMGHVLRVPFAFVGVAQTGPVSWPEFLQTLAGMGVATCAMTPRQPDGTVDLNELATNGGGQRQSVAVLIGSEGPGLTAEALALAKCKVSIAMVDGTDSLNAYVAGAVALHRLSTPS